MKYISIDIETTGLNPETCNIIEFGAILDDTEKLDPLDKLATFHCYILPPEKTYTGEPYALSMHPEKFKRIATRTKGFDYWSGSKLGFGFKTFLLENGYSLEEDRVHINVAGKNFGTFDLQFLKKLDGWVKHIDVRHRIIDPSILYWDSEDETLPGTELCKQRCGLIELVKHDVISDCMDVIQLVRYKLSS